MIKGSANMYPSFYKMTYKKCTFLNYVSGDQYRSSRASKYPPNSELEWAGDNLMVQSMAIITKLGSI